ncbi:uncharacterized protein LOC126236445 [Schistocerca nitens]|uniref:uncharacterized protein LOC126236445 n=1 Tax=Schistocerca nitens TaxID=7011 RepID=UPI00211772B1|nr:uncharacterized protein LOC126236445 [Schistocerca nitens]
MASKVVVTALELNLIRCVQQRWRLSAVQQLAQYSSHHNSRRNPEDHPIKYTSSEAAAWKAVQARGGEEDDRPWYQGIVISASLGIFLIYFCILREENDMDEELGKSLYDRVPGLEEQQLNVTLKYYKERGMDTREIETRLNQLKNQVNSHDE